MADSFVQKSVQKKDWTLSPPALNRLFDWLDEGRNSEGLKFLEMRQRLVAYFDRKNCAAPDELADEVMNCVARRLEEEGAIESETPAKYCYIVARFVFMEYLRETEKEDRALADIRSQSRKGNPILAVDEKDDSEKMLNCLDRCTGGLESSNRELILRYYVGEGRVKIENRRALAKSLGSLPLRGIVSFHPFDHALWTRGKLSESK